MARAAVWTALDTLAPRRRAVIVMHELEGLDVREIGVLLGISGSDRSAGTCRRRAASSRASSSRGWERT